MRKAARLRAGLFAALTAAGAACGGGDTTGPDTGRLQVAVSGLPGDVPAAVSVAGPGGFVRTLDGPETISGLLPGAYTVTGAVVTADNTHYAAVPASQNVTVNGGITSTSSVSYTVASGTLTVTISGLPAGTDAAVAVTGPNGFSETVTASRTLVGLVPGTYTVAAQPVASGSVQYIPSPGSQEAAVTAGDGAAANVVYEEAASAGLNFRVAGVHLTQSVQNLAGEIPLVAGRDALLRVFVTANQTNLISPDVRVRLYHGALQVEEQVLSRVGPTPQSPQEETLGSSWNLPVSKALITSNLAIRVDVDPGNNVVEANEADNTFPALGTPLALEVVTASPFRVTLVPVATTSDGRIGNVTNANRDEFLATAMRMHPLSSYDAVVGAPLTIAASVPPVQSNNANNSWNTILSELQARRANDGSTRTYFGVVNPAYASGVAGMGYVGFPVALGWDKLPSAASVAAHEWGHNWDRKHAPCGDAANPDASYPYSGGTIGVIGYDLVTGSLKPNSSHDLMGYCSNEWISDYTYRGVMLYRSAAAGVGSELGQAMQPALVVWGRIEQGEAVLEPAFQAVTRPSLPRRDGRYTIEARSDDGARVFSLRFEPLEIADDPNGGRHFAFAVPLTPERQARIHRITLAGEGRSATLSRGTAAASPVEVRRTGGGRAELRWDASRTPMVVVRHPTTGQVLSFARGGRAEVPADGGDLSLTLSDRVRSRDLRLKVPAR